MHRDLKPENLIFDSKGYLHLADLGIARIYDTLNPVIDSSGTPGYLAPEILMNIPNEPTVDYFALGVITYELVFNKVRFKKLLIHHNNTLVKLLTSY